MKFEEIKQNLFGGFLKWLEVKGVGDHFSADVWGNKCFDVMYQQFVEEMQNDFNLKKMIYSANPNDVEKILNERKDAIKKKEEEFTKQLEQEKQNAEKK